MAYRLLIDKTEDDDDFSYTTEELPELKRNAEQRLRLSAKRLIVSGLAFFLSCAAIIPFLYGHSLHEYWGTFGMYLLFLSLALLFPFVMCVAMTFTAWIFLRNWQKKDCVDQSA
jgi:Na+/melibiose symporter-like transporter